LEVKVFMWEYRLNQRADESRAPMSGRLVVVLLVAWELQQFACAQNTGAPATAANAPCTTQQVVENLVGRNLVTVAEVETPKKQDEPPPPTPSGFLFG
jgi:hypothetical protein